MSRLSKTQGALVVAALVGLTAAVWISRTRRRCRITQSTQETAQESTLSDAQLFEKFQQAAETSRTLQNLAHGDKLLLYGLYKQATVGNVDESQEPSRFNFVEHAKYEGWLKFKGMSKEAAMRSYIQVVLEFSNPTETMEYETEELDMFNAMGVKPSTLAGKEEENDDDEEYSPLQKASRNGNLQQVKQLLEKDDDTITTVNTADESGQTALHFAADRGYTDICSTLLDAGANPNATDLEGIGVLQAAVIAGHADVASLLLERGANPQQADMDGDTPLSCARDDGSDEMKQLFRVSSETALFEG